MKTLFIKIYIFLSLSIAMANESAREGQVFFKGEYGESGLMLIKGDAAKALFELMGDQTLSPTRIPQYFAKKGKNYTCSTIIGKNDYTCIIHIDSVEKGKIRKH